MLALPAEACRRIARFVGIGQQVKLFEEPRCLQFIAYITRCGEILGGKAARSEERDLVAAC